MYSRNPFIKKRFFPASPGSPDPGLSYRRHLADMPLRTAALQKDRGQAGLLPKCSARVFFTPPS
jgi:hypothetical protein